jgi:hypothetical protein
MCSSTPSPDPLIGQAALANTEIARQAMDYYKQKDAAAAPRQARMDDLTEKLANQQIDSSKFNDDAARKMLARYESVGMPAEDAMYKDASTYDTAAKREQAAGVAGTDVDMATAAAQDAQRRNLARAGVNPADGRSLSMGQDAATTGALAKAGAMNGARQKVADMGIMLRKDAASFAKGMPGNAAQTFGTAAMAGNGATGAAGAGINSANQTTQTNGAGFGTAIQGNNSAGSILNQEYSNNIQANNQGGLAAGIGGIASGLGAMGVKFAPFAISDENQKEDIAPVSDESALAGVEKTKVKSWKYKPGSVGDDGGQPHIGAMAQDMQKNLGNTVAPGGKVVDVVSALGVNMAATKALSAKVSKLQKTISKGVRA